MGARTVGLIAIGLWLVTAVGFGVMFVKGQTLPAEDGRTTIVLSPAEKEAVLAEMRHMLETVQAVTAALADDDIVAAANAARQSGTAAAADMNPALMTKLPLDFKQFGMSVHAEFDALATRADQGADRTTLLRGLADQLSSCVACHASYRLGTEQ
mgnify:CR=1 FL=1